MKIKLDENLPSELVATLSAENHDVDTVRSEGLAGQDDDSIWRACQEDERLLVTQDLDFSDARRFAPGTHHGLVLLRLRDPSRSALAFRVRSLLRANNIGDWARCFVVVTDHKIRVRRSAR